MKAWLYRSFLFLEPFVTMNGWKWEALNYSSTDLCVDLIQDKSTIRRKLEGLVWCYDGKHASSIWKRNIGDKMGNLVYLSSQTLIMLLTDVTVCCLTSSRPTHFGRTEGSSARAQVRDKHEMTIWSQPFNYFYNTIGRSNTVYILVLKQTICVK